MWIAEIKLTMVPHESGDEISRKENKLILVKSFQAIKFTCETVIHGNVVIFIN